MLKACSLSLLFVFEVLPFVQKLRQSSLNQWANHVTGTGLEFIGRDLVSNSLVWTRSVLQIARTNISHKGHVRYPCRHLEMVQHLVCLIEIDAPVVSAQARLDGLKAIIGS